MAARKRKKAASGIVAHNGIDVDEKLRSAQQSIRDGKGYEVLAMFDRTAERVSAIDRIIVWTNHSEERKHLQAIQEEHRRLASGMLRLLFPYKKGR